MNKIKITEKNKYDTKDIAKWIRQTLKEEIKDCKFSVRSEYYSGGSSIDVNIKESKNVRIVKKPEEVTEEEILHLMSARNDSREETIERIKRMQNCKHYSVNQYHIDSDWQFTTKGKELLKKVIEITNKYNYDNSDVMTDYFDVNYYLHIVLGDYNKLFIDGLN